MDSDRRNYAAFMIHALFLALTKNFIDTNTVIPMMILSVGGNAVHIGILSAILIGGTKLMQLVFAGMIMPLEKKKGPLLIGINIRVASLLVLSFLLISNVSSVFLIIVVMTVFSFSGAYANIPYTDIMGKSIKAEKRKKLLVNKQLISSVGVIISSLIVKFLLTKYSYPVNYSILFFSGGILLLLGTSGFWVLDEKKSIKGEKLSLVKQLGQFKKVFVEDKNFRKYLLFLNTTGVVIATLPFYIPFVKSNIELADSLTGTFLLVQMGGALSVNILLNLFSKDQKYRSLLYLLVAISFITPLLALVLPANYMAYYPIFILGGAAFSLTEILSAGILLEISSDENRSLYTGLSGFGSLMQVIYPLLFGFVVAKVGYKVVFIVTSFYLLIGIFAAHSLKCNRLEIVNQSETTL